MLVRASSRRAAKTGRPRMRHNIVNHPLRYGRIVNSRGHATHTFGKDFECATKTLSWFITRFSFYLVAIVKNVLLPVSVSDSQLALARQTRDGGLLLLRRRRSFCIQAWRDRFTMAVLRCCSQQRSLGTGPARTCQVFRCRHCWLLGLGRRERRELTR